METRTGVDTVAVDNKPGEHAHGDAPRVNQNPGDVDGSVGSEDLLSGDLRSGEEDQRLDPGTSVDYPDSGADGGNPDLGVGPLARHPGDSRRADGDRRAEHDRRRGAVGLFEFRARREGGASDRRQRERRYASRLRDWFSVWRRPVS